VSWLVNNAAGRLARAARPVCWPQRMVSRLDDMRQGDLFDDQPDLFPEEEPSYVVRVDPEEVRARLHAILGELRAASVMPWDAGKVLYWRTVAPQTSRWLPNEERAQLLLEFETEMRRLGAWT